MEDLGANNPLRPVDWRSRTAAFLAAAMRAASPQRHDQATHSLVAFLTAQRRAASIPRFRNARQKSFSNWAAAYDIQRSVDQSLPYAIQALLLTDRTIEEIATAIGVTNDVIQSYADAFFDVRERLGATQFISQVVLEGSRVRNPDDWRDYGWKAVAFSGGAEALDAVMGAGRANDSQQLTDMLRTQSRFIVKEKLRRLALDCSAEDPTVLLKMAQLDIAAAESPPNDALNHFEENVNACLEALKFDVGKPDAVHPGLEPFAATAAELRAEE